MGTSMHGEPPQTYKLHVFEDVASNVIPRRHLTLGADNHEAQRNTPCVVVHDGFHTHGRPSGQAHRTVVLLAVRRGTLGVEGGVVGVNSLEGRRMDPERNALTTQLTDRKVLIPGWFIHTRRGTNTTTTTRPKQQNKEAPVQQGTQQRAEWVSTCDAEQVHPHSLHAPPPPPPRT